jgi:hypothetical protein
MDHLKDFLSTWQHMGYSAAALFMVSAGVLAIIAYLLWSENHDGTRAELRAIRRHNKRVRRTHIRVRADEIDPAIITGQFYVPTQFRDMKDKY